MRINKESYIERVSKGSGTKGKGTYSKKIFRDWWLVKDAGKKKYRIGIVQLAHIYFPKHLVGKRVRFKVELLGRQL